MLQKVRYARIISEIWKGSLRQYYIRGFREVDPTKPLI